MTHETPVSYSHAGPSVSEDKYQSLEIWRMFLRDWTLEMIFLLQTVVGILGNFSLLFHYLFLYFTKCKLRSTHLTLIHLIVGNSLVVISKGLTKTMAAFGWNDLLNDFGCKFVSYVRRVGRGVSIGSTCLLSIFQAITISPSNSRWAELKAKVPKYRVFSIYICWLLHLLVNIIFPMYVTSNWSNESITNRKLYGSCASVRHDKTINSLYTVMLSFPDAVSLALMLWASGTMVFILHRHKQRLRHIHRSKVSPRSSPETRATQTILILMSTFLSSYTLSIILQVSFTVVHHPNWWLMYMDVLSGMFFPAILPFVLMSRDPTISMLCMAWIRRSKFPFLRNT